MESIKTVASAPRGCLRRYRGGPQSLVRLVCFPWAGGGASAYRRFAARLPETIELLAVQLPGREDRFHERGLVRMGAIVDHVLEELLLAPPGPLVLFGHSMGALVAYEVAQALKARGGQQPALLIVSGSGPPASERSYNRCAFNASDEEFIAELRRLGGTPPEVLADQAMMSAVVRVLRADYEVLDRYDRDAPTTLSCPLVACAGDQDPSVPPSTLSGWRRYTSGPSKQSWFRGGHFHLCEQPQEVTNCLQQWIAGAGLALRRGSRPMSFGLGSVAPGFPVRSGSRPW